MDIGGFGMIVVIGVLVIAGVALVLARSAGALGRRDAGSALPHDPKPSAPTPPAGPPRLSDQLDTLQKTGDWPELLRLLDRTMPEWVVAGSLIETARELSALEAGITNARGNGVTEEVTGRLTLQVELVSTDLWALADNIAAADQIGSRAPREALERHDEALVRLQGGIRDAREGLAELGLSDIGGWDDLRSAEGRFRSLAATARELHDWEREQVPW